MCHICASLVKNGLKTLQDKYYIEYTVESRAAVITIEQLQTYDDELPEQYPLVLYYEVMLFILKQRD